MPPPGLSPSLDHERELPVVPAIDDPSRRDGLPHGMAINEIALSIIRRVKLLISIGINKGKGKRDVKGLPYALYTECYYYY